MIDENGKTTKVDKEKENTLSSKQRDLIEHCKNCFEHCRLLENAISVLEGEREWGSYFPLIVGRRPTQKKDSKEQDYQKYVNVCLLTTVCKYAACTYHILIFVQ